MQRSVQLSVPALCGPSVQRLLGSSPSNSGQQRKEDFLHHVISCHGSQDQRKLALQGCGIMLDGTAVQQSSVSRLTRSSIVTHWSTSSFSTGALVNCTETMGCAIRLLLNSLPCPFPSPPYPFSDKKAKHQLQMRKQQQKEQQKQRIAEDEAQE